MLSGSNSYRAQQLEGGSQVVIILAVVGSADVAGKHFSNAFAPTFWFCRRWSISDLKPSATGFDMPWQSLILGLSHWFIRWCQAACFSCGSVQRTWRGGALKLRGASAMESLVHKAVCMDFRGFCETKAIGRLRAAHETELKQTKARKRPEPGDVHGGVHGGVYGGVHKQCMPFVMKHGGTGQLFIQNSFLRFF